MTNTDLTAVDRIPVAHSVRYAARGLPEVPNQYGPGVLVPSEITLTYRAAPNSGLGRVHAYVAGRIWVDGNELPLLPGGLYGQHYDEGLDGWPDWLAEEARLHDPATAGVSPDTDELDRLRTENERMRHELEVMYGGAFDKLKPATDRAGLREQIAEALYRHNHPGWATRYADLDQDERDTYLGRADAVLSVLPVTAGQADRAAVLEEAAAECDRVAAIYAKREMHESSDAVAAMRIRLRRMAAVPAGSAGAGHGGSETDGDDPTESVIYEVVGDWGVDSADSAAGARAAVAKWLRAYPKCGAFAQQRIVREWPDGSEFYGPWTDLPDEPAAGQSAGGTPQPKEA